ncbi:MAG: hypothetical protein PHZ09_00820 [Eubacteriales bacterium]|nr:hypothetical protein [Eubacteriales bacterium]
MKEKKQISVILIFSMLMTTLLMACAQSDDAKITSETSDSVSSTGGIDSAETTLLDQIQEKDYNGYEFNYLALNAGINATTRFVDEMWVESEVGEVIIDAVYARNLYLSDMLNILITVTPNTDPPGAFSKAVTAGDNAYDMAGVYKWNAMNLASQGYARNWNDLDIDYSQPWWSQGAVEKLQVLDAQFLMSGSILISEIDDTLAMIYNKGLAENYNIGDIYGDVREMKWTIDKFGEYVTQIAEDLNGDGKYKAGDDLLGYVQDPASMTNNWVFSTGLLNGYIDEDGLYDMNVDINRSQSVLDKLSPLFNSDSVVSGIDLYEGLNYFEENKIFMYAIILRNLELLREMDLDFGVIPYPMYDENQGRYITHVGSASPILIIPLLNTEDDQMLADILVAMAMSSAHFVIPAYYDTALKVKISRDNESAEMLDIILETKTYDITYLIGSGLVSTMAPLLTRKSIDFASSWAKTEERTLKIIQQTIDKLVEATYN